MVHRPCLSALVLSFVPALALGGHPHPDSRALTLADRIQCQEAIERVYYSHQLGTTRPFGEAVPRTVVEQKVRTHLKEAAALEGRWSTPVSGAALRAEMDRIARNTQTPYRLNEVYAALDGDPFLVEECFARPVLVDRLARGFFAFDERVHASARQEAETLRQRLASGEQRLEDPDPRREVLEVVKQDSCDSRVGAPESDAAPVPGAVPAPIRTVRLDVDRFHAWRSSVPARPGEVAPVEALRDAFVVRAVLAESEGAVRIATYRVPKRSWESWWSEVETDWDEDTVAAVSLADREPGGRPLPPREVVGQSVNTCPPDGTWDNLSLDDAQQARERHSAVWTGSVMIVWGGRGSSYQDTRTGSRYDPLTDTWSATSIANAPEARADHTAVWTGSEMVVWGGVQTDWPNAPVGSGGRYDPATDAWTPVSSIGAPTARHGHTAVWTGSRMIVWGGFDSLHGTQGANTGARYDPATDTWSPTGISNAPASRFEHSAIWTGSRMIVFGGHYYTYGWSGEQALGTGGAYNPATDSWSATPTAGAPSPRLRHAAIWTGSRMVVWGGRSGSTALADGRRYDPVASEWSPISTSGAPEARSEPSSVWTGSQLLVWGGYGPSQLQTGGRYNPVADLWSPMTTLNAPAARAGAPMVWTGSLAVVWGNVGLQRSGGRYDPGTDVWTPIGPEAVPEPRFAQASVWTGSLFIVWGGLAAGSSLNTGGRYDPLIDAWTPTSTAGAPLSESDRAVWSGEEMLVWRASGRYNPISDTWAPISTVNAPGYRSEYSLVWSGRYMIVWGGIAGGEENFNTGGRYDPRTDTWLATSTVNAPSRRQEHTAVWTGSRMIVWGGYNRRTYDTYGTGSAYDPEADAWTAISAVNAPSPRHIHASVWTGDRMIVWGGYGTDYVNSGGIYDPDADAWTATSTNGAPTARLGHTATWTNGRMVVWGGEYSEAIGGEVTYSYPAAGGSYDPGTDEWQEVTAAGAPPPRTYHSVAWTGDAFLLWGGYRYADQELFGDGGRYLLGQTADFDQDGVSLCAGDCDDNDAARYPGAAEICNGLDDDCDASLPAGEADNDGDRAPLCNDCDDANPLTRPGAPEICDDRDNDCDGVRDAFVSTCGLGQCTSAGFCSAGFDACQPGNPSAEVCDGVDNSCDGVLSATEMDLDGDGFGICEGDCSDVDDATYPGATEQNDHEDNQCPGDFGHGLVDEITGGPTFVLPPGPTSVCWPPQLAATRYEVSRSSIASVAAPCATWTTESACIEDAEPPPPGGVFYYLAQATRPFAGSMGVRAPGPERTVVCGRESDCDDYSDNDGDGRTNCGDIDCFGKAGCDSGSIFISDTAGDDVSTTALAQQLAAIPVEVSHYLGLSVQLPNAPRFEICTARADWYRDRYLELAPTAGAATSGSWEKWYRAGTGPWIGPDTAGYENWFGNECSDVYSWCVEAYLGGHVPGVAPSFTGICEVFDVIDCGDGAWVSIAVGETRSAACGF